MDEPIPTPVKRPRRTTKQTIEQPATVTVNLLEVVGLLNSHDTRIANLERDHKELAVAVREIRLAQETTKESIDSIEDKLIKHMSGMNEGVQQVQEALGTLSTRLEDIAKITQSRESAAEFVRVLQEREVKHEQDITARVKFATEQAEVATKRHDEMARKFNTWVSVVILIVGNVAVKTFAIPQPYQLIVAGISIFVGLCFFLILTFYNGPLSKARVERIRRKAMENYQHDNS